MPPKAHYFARIPTIALLVLFALSPWIGIAAFIARKIDRDLLRQEQANADYAGDFRAQDTRAASGNETVYGHDIPTQEQKDAKLRHKRLTTLCSFLGVLFLLSGISGLTDVLSSWFYLPDWRGLLNALARALGGGGALWLGLRMKNTRKLERLMDKIVNDRDNIALEELYAAAGVDAIKGRSAVESAIEHGYFGADAYIDSRTDTLVVRGAAPQPQPEPAAEPVDPYTALQAQLHQTGNAVTDPQMRVKVSRLEELTDHIFVQARQNSAKKAQLQKFVDYYLPTAIRLLQTYVRLPAQQVQGENIAEARQSIERSMDLLITAFENQLDKLFAADTLDVTADIAALEGMLDLDGLTESDFAP